MVADMDLETHPAEDGDDELARMQALNDRLLAVSFDEDVRAATIAAAEKAAEAWVLMANRGADYAAAAAGILSTINVHLINQIVVNLGLLAPKDDEPEEPA